MLALRIAEHDGRILHAGIYCVCYCQVSIIVWYSLELASNRGTELFTNNPGLTVADLSFMVLPNLMNAAGAELMHLRTRWGLHAMHYAAGNLVQGCQVLTQMIEYCKISSNQVLHCHLLVILFSR